MLRKELMYWIRGGVEIGKESSSNSQVFFLIFILYWSIVD